MMDRLADELGHGPARAAAQELHPQGGVPVRDRRSGSSTTRATTTARSTGCSRTSTSTRSARSRASCASEGIYRGVGFSTWVEVCGLAPSRAVGPQGVGLQAAFWESAMVRVTPTGSATVYTGTSPHGQGLDTSFAQIAGDILGIDPQNVDVVHGDTDQGPWGWDTYGSRSLAVGGEAIVRAARKGAGQGQAHLRGAAGGGAGGHRAGRRQVPGARLARQVDDHGRDLGRGAHPAERAAGRHRARPRGELVLRPGELRVPVRRARVRGRRGRGDRQGEGRALRGGGRLRPGDQPDADRRPDARRHRARDRPGALRAGRLRRGRPARDRHVRGLRAADGGRAARASRPTAPRRRRRSTRSA